MCFMMVQDVGDADEGHLRKVFNALDLNGDGEITIDELQQVAEILQYQRCRFARSRNLGPCRHAPTPVRLKCGIPEIRVLSLFKKFQ